jgi:hypothetical protein
MPVIPPTPQVIGRRIAIQRQPWAKSMTLSEKITEGKRARNVA